MWERTSRKPAATSAFAIGIGIVDDAHVDWTAIESSVLVIAQKLDAQASFRNTGAGENLAL